MSPAWTPRVRRIAALAILAGVLGALWLGLCKPTIELFEHRGEQRSLSLKALKRERALLMQEPTLRAALAAVKESPRWRNFYSADSADTAELQLETDLREILKGSNNPVSMTAAPATSKNAITRIRVGVTLAMRIDEFAAALDRIQKLPRQLTIDSLSVQAPDFQDPNVNPILNIQVSVSALMLNSAGHST